MTVIRAILFGSFPHCLKVLMVYHVNDISVAVIFNYVCGFRKNSSIRGIFRRMIID